MAKIAFVYPDWDFECAFNLDDLEYIKLQNILRAFKTIVVVHI